MPLSKRAWACGRAEPTAPPLALRSRLQRRQLRARRRGLASSWRRSNSEITRRHGASLQADRLFAQQHRARVSSTCSLERAATRNRTSHLRGERQAYRFARASSRRARPSQPAHRRAAPEEVDFVGGQVSVAR